MLRGTKTRHRKEGEPLRCALIREEEDICGGEVYILTSPRGNTRYLCAKCEGRMIMDLKERGWEWERA